MRILVLGSAAGGGVPQWNCRCPVCRIAWSDPVRVKPRSETGVAVSADGIRYVLLDASPALREQILRTPALQPRDGLRGSPIEAVFLTGGDVDHVAGLLCLREGHRFAVYGSPPTLANLAASPVFDVLRADLVARHPLEAERPVEVAGLTITPFAVPGKVPLYREDGRAEADLAADDVIGLSITDGRRRLVYVPGLAALTGGLRDRLAAADLLLLEGTTFTDDELPRAGLSHKTARRMGHLPMMGEGGSLHAFGAGAPPRKVYIHVNNSNPALIEDSPERAEVEAAGWEVAHDGMELELP